MKKLKILLCGLLGISIITATMATGAAVEPTGVAGDLTDTASEETAAIVPYLVYPDADKDDPDIVCPEDYERIPCDDGVTFRSKVTKTPDLTALTPDEHNEYADGDFYIVEDVYVQKDEQPDASVNSASAWESETITVNRSIYQDPDKAHGSLLAEMIITAKFRWNGETAEVVGTPYCHTNIRSAGEEIIIAVRNKEVHYASDQGSNFLFGNKYAYVEYIVTLTYDLKSIGLGVIPMDYRLYVSVNRNRDMNTEN